jgi:hypothetical protein
MPITEPRARWTIRAQQPDRVGGAAGAGVVLNIREQDRPCRAPRQAHRFHDSFVGSVEPAGESRLLLLDKTGKTIRYGFGGLLIMAVDDERRTALGDVGRRETGCMCDADDALIVCPGRAAGSIAAALDLADQLEDALRRLH